MPSEHSSDVKFEIGHVLFIDIVGYSSRENLSCDSDNVCFTDGAQDEISYSRRGSSRRI
jgi:hypothetical protein